MCQGAAHAKTLCVVLNVIGAARHFVSCTTLTLRTGKTTWLCGGRKDGRGKEGRRDVIGCDGMGLRIKVPKIMRSLNMKWNDTDSMSGKVRANLRRVDELIVALRPPPLTPVSQDPPCPHTQQREESGSSLTHTRQKNFQTMQNWGAGIFVVQHGSPGWQPPS